MHTISEGGIVRKLRATDKFMPDVAYYRHYEGEDVSKVVRIMTCYDKNGLCEYRTEFHIRGNNICSFLTFNTADGKTNVLQQNLPASAVLTDRLVAGLLCGMTPESCLQQAATQKKVYVCDLVV